MPSSSFSISSARRLDGLRDLGLLGLRLWLAQEFIQAGWVKLAAGPTPPEWFATLMLPWPVSLLGTQVNWLAAGVVECLAGLALLVGLHSRLAALALLFVTWVAVVSVHFDLGWAGWNQIETEAGLGFKVPLMLALMLLAVFTQGPGRWSLDHGLGLRQAP
ncbi:MAG: DoxX family protein [Proteobacteria bacterium]|nr:DoxX family protein [Pseudomonadota bacterium]